MHKERPLPGTTSNPIKVEVHARLDVRTRKVTFSDEWEAPWKDGPQKGPIKVPVATPAMEIHFHLRDDTGLHLGFMRDAEDVIWVGTGPECPPPKGNKGGQITVVQSNLQLLKVNNANSGAACDLKYALRFNGRDNILGGENQPYVYDPDLKNGGGGTGGVNNRILYLLIGGAAAAALGFFAYQFFIDN